MSSARERAVPNWVLKSTMAATGTALAIMLVIHLTLNLSSPITITDTWLWVIRGLVLACAAVHVAIGAALMVRSKAGRGPSRAKLHGGWHAWLTRLMPYTGAAILLFAVFYMLDQVPVMKPWGAVVTIIGLVALAAHVLHGLGTVATIAAGGGQLGARVKRVLVIGGGAVIGALMLANLLIPVVVLWGWLR